MMSTKNDQFCDPPTRIPAPPLANLIFLKNGIRVDFRVDVINVLSHNLFLAGMISKNESMGRS